MVRTASPDCFTKLQSIKQVICLVFVQNGDSAGSRVGRRNPLNEPVAPPSRRVSRAARRVAYVPVVMCGVSSIVPRTTTTSRRKIRSPASGRPRSGGGGQSVTSDQVCRLVARTAAASSVGCGAVRDGGVAVAAAGRWCTSSCRPSPSCRPRTTITTKTTRPFFVRRCCAASTRFSPCSPFAAAARCCSSSHHSIAWRCSTWTPSCLCFSVRARSCTILRSISIRKSSRKPIE